MKILYKGGSMSIIVDHTIKTFDYYSENLIPNYELMSVDYTLESIKDYEILDLIRLFQINDYKENR